MRVLSICSECVRKALSYDTKKDILQIEFKILTDILKDNDTKFKIINSKYDEVNIDILSILKDHYLKNNLIKNDKSDGSKLLVLEEKKEIYIQIVNTIINKIVKNIYVDKINILRINFNDDRNEIKEINNNLNEIYDEIIKYNPSINIVQGEAFLDSNNKILNLDLYKDKKEKYRGERVYPSTRNIRYIFEKAKLFNKDKLIIVFSAFSKDKAKYNYINTLKCVDCNKLFILDDYGVKGTYYIGLDGQCDIETSVISLITDIMGKYDITFKNVISAGSSKGGSAAIYYGIKYNFGAVIAGAPQYRIGTYLCDLSIKNYANEIFGSCSISNRIKYDNLINMIIKKQQYTKINILTGEGDPQYKRVLKDFEEEAKIFNLNLNEKLININGHDEIAKKFPEYLLENIMIFFNGKGCLQNNKFLNIFKRL